MQRNALVARIIRIYGYVVPNFASAYEGPAERDAFNSPACSLMLCQVIGESLAQVGARWQFMSFEHSIVCIQTRKPTRRVTRFQRIETLPSVDHRSEGTERPRVTSNQCLAELHAVDAASACSR